MKYIGNKSRLLGFIDKVVAEEKLPDKGTFIDVFTGTTSVAQHYKKKGYRIIANDFMTYSYVFQNAYIKNNKYPGYYNLFKNENIGSFQKAPRAQETALSTIINYLNNIPGKEGFVFQHYAPAGEDGRQFFSNENAKKIDAIRDKIEIWKSTSLIDEDEFYVLLSSLIDAADFVANMSGTYGAYLKIWRPMALKKLNMAVPRLISSEIDHKIYKQDANKLIRNIAGDIIYIDPPYNGRQYAPNFHVLETLACWDNPKLKGKTGLRPYDEQKSLYSLKSSCNNAFSDLIANTSAEYILLSYNNEGIIPEEFIKKVLSKKGKLRIYEQEYRRFRTERDHLKRRYKVPDNKVKERIYFVKVN